jgi:hypothetical protein
MPGSSFYYKTSRSLKFEVQSLTSLVTLCIYDMLLCALLVCREIMIDGSVIKLGVFLESLGDGKWLLLILGPEWKTLG